MRSRSYSTIKGGSACLIVIACYASPLYEEDAAQPKKVVAVEAEPSVVIESCPEDQMLFEGACAPKTKVAAIIEQRDEAVIQQLQSAPSESDSVDMQHQLIEQQIVTAEKAENDLDQIIHSLRKKEQARLVEKPLPVTPTPRNNRRERLRVGNL